MLIVHRRKETPKSCITLVLHEGSFVTTFTASWEVQASQETPAFQAPWVSQVRPHNISSRLRTPSHGVKEAPIACVRHII